MALAAMARSANFIVEARRRSGVGGELWQGVRSEWTDGATAPTGAKEERRFISRAHTAARSAAICVIACQQH